MFSSSCSSSSPSSGAIGCDRAAEPDLVRRVRGERFDRAGWHARREQGFRVLQHDLLRTIAPERVVVHEPARQELARMTGDRLLWQQVTAEGRALLLGEMLPALLSQLRVLRRASPALIVVVVAVEPAPEVAPGLNRVPSWPSCLRAATPQVQVVPGRRCARRREQRVLRAAGFAHARNVAVQPLGA